MSSINGSTEAHEPAILNVHTPSSSFAIIHSTNESVTALFNALSRKHNTDFHGKRVGPGWIKYEWNESVWNLDDDADYTIFAWRLKSTSAAKNESPTIFLRDPQAPLPTISDGSYRNPSFYLFRPGMNPPTYSEGHHDAMSVKSKKSAKSMPNHNALPKHKKDFEKFHSGNGVRTITGSIGPVQGVRMLLKNGYRYVYISRKFAMKHGFIPADAAPGHYGYGGLVNIGKWPITVGRTKTIHSVFLSEESHFDVVLGRSFMEKRQIKTNPVDPTDVVCLDTGEKLDCELVILKDGKGEIVTVT
ncbi:uncharacterized protein STEHIDRAFT_74325 [Stereum hirsutum FP-91666 SS1]|uniref:uncharacterized protein n=1 Tax=Stereum hirsutum (strain FP-91666) TaxID=721885 RepID=UPI000440CE1A|nr:uncharacterized protein STEHIDRAFT_74325 [Stereum hirsutum FP-91666 SS1]EIM89939.1 hypothetical protein STEHIDRAFT_74325 [Stereum hirsutum FP-91666 SS1]